MFDSLLPLVGAGNLPYAAQPGAGVSPVPQQYGQPPQQYGQPPAGAPAGPPPEQLYAQQSQPKPAKGTY